MRSASFAHLIRTKLPSSNQCRISAPSLVKSAMRKASQGCIVASAILVTKYIGAFTRSDALRLRGRSEGFLALLCRLGGHSYELYDAQS